MRFPQSILIAALSFGVTTLAGPGLAAAYEFYDDPTSGMPGCVDCHGGFRSSPYTSLSDGMDWATTSTTSTEA